MSLKQVPTRWHDLPPLQFIAEAVSYRQPRPVVEILQHANGDSYPICPRCKIPLEREYMRFCDRCGQNLDWADIESAQVHSWVK